MTPIFRTPLEVINLWITALESGEYPQATGKLRKKGSDNDGFCCLGVLCDLAAKDGGDQWEDDISHYYYKNWLANLPPVMINYLGITAEERSILIRMNDSKTHTFLEIAAYIRKNILPRYQEKVQP